MTAARPCRFCGSTAGPLVSDEPVTTRGWCGSPNRTYVTRRHLDCEALFEAAERQAEMECKAHLYDYKEASAVDDEHAADAAWEAYEAVKVTPPAYPAWGAVS